MKNLKKLIGTIAICLLTAIVLTGCDDLLKMAGEDDITIAKKYTVTFDSDGGSTVASQVIIKDNCATEPKDPKKDNSIFTGWYLGDSLYSFTTPVTASITLKAHWRAKATFTVAFDTDGAGQISSKTVAEGDLVTEPAVELKKNGFEFIGWYNGDYIFSFSTPVTSNLELKAKWVEASSYQKETLDISVFTIQNRVAPPADNKTYKWIKNTFGVEFSWDILLGNKDQKIGLLIASGDLPDLVEVDSAKFQGARCLRDLKPLIEKYCPNLMKHYSSAWRKMIDIDSEKDANGNITKQHVYSLPNYGVLDGVDSGTYFNQNAFWIQKAVLKEYGYPVIKTVDQYFDLLEKYYKKYPTIDGLKTIPFSIITADWEAFNLWNPPNFLSGHPNDGNGHVDYVNGQYVYSDNFTDKYAHQWFKLANSYYNRGLYDPESFTDNREEYYAKIAQGRVLGMFIQGWEFMGEPEQSLWIRGKDERTYAPLAITFDDTIKPHYRDQSLPNLQKGYGITVNCSEEKAIKILKFMDEMLKEENQKVLYWGFEGEDYLVDASGKPYRTNEQRVTQNDPEWQQNNRALLWAEEAPKLEGTLPSGYTRSMDELPWEYEETQKAIDKEVWAAYGVGSYAELVDPNPPKNTGWYPLWQCNPSAGNGGLEAEAAIAMSGFEAIQRKLLPKMIMGKPEDFEATWADYISQMTPLTTVYNQYMQQQLNHRVSLFGGTQ